MRKSLVWRVLWMGTLLLLGGTGVVWSQVGPPSLQSGTAWSGPFQPDIGGSDNRSQPVAPAATSPDITGETSGDSSAQSPADSVANNPNSTITDAVIKQLGTPFPLQLEPRGLKIGPMYLTSVSDSLFYVVNNAPGEPTQTLAGNSTAANLVYSRPLSRGTLAVQGMSQFSISGAQPYFNQTAVASFNEQLTDRWSLVATAAFSYFENSLLANPQSLLSYSNAGVVQQTAFLQQRGLNMYESNNISLGYQMGGKTQISFSPIVGATFQYLDGGWSNVHQFGGAVTVTRGLTTNLTGSVFYSLSYSATSGAASSSPGWVGQNFGVSFQGKLLQRETWSIGGSIAMSSQRYSTGGYTFTPVGNLTLQKTFHQGGSIAAAYSRTEAANILVSNGYYDQGDISYNQRFGTKWGFNVGVGAFRTSNSTSNENGKRAGGGVGYQLSPRVSLHGNYNFAHQNGTQATFYTGNTNFLSFGVTWSVGAQSGL